MPMPRGQISRASVLGLAKDRPGGLGAGPEPAAGAISGHAGSDAPGRAVPLHHQPRQRLPGHHHPDLRRPGPRPHRLLGQPLPRGQRVPPDAAGSTPGATAVGRLRRGLGRGFGGTLLPPDRDSCGADVRATPAPPAASQSQAATEDPRTIGLRLAAFPPGCGDAAAFWQTSDPVWQPGRAGK